MVHKYAAAAGSNEEPEFRGFICRISGSCDLIICADLGLSITRFSSKHDLQGSTELDANLGEGDLQKN